MESRSVLIACPMTREADVLRAQLTGREILATGLGIQRTVPALLSRFRRSKPSLLIFTGSAGQLDLGLEMKDLVLPRTWCLEEGPPCFDSPPELLERLETAGFEIAPKGLSLTRPVARARQRRELHERTRAVVFDRVTAAVLRVADTSGVPCVAPKIVANTTRSGLTRFWQRLDENLAPLAEYLERMLEVLGV